MKKPPNRVAFREGIKISKGMKSLEVANDVAENVANNRAKQQENSDNHNGDQDEDQRILYQTLTFFAWEK
jgi:hypothetical protein